MVREMKSPRGERALQEAIAQGFVTENGEKRSDLAIPEDKNSHKNGHEDDQKPTKKQPKKRPNQEEKQPKIKVSDFPKIQVLSLFNSNLSFISSFVFGKGLHSVGLLIIFKGIPLLLVLIKLGSNNGST